jgi:hypothetical protein
MTGCLRRYGYDYYLARGGRSVHASPTAALLRQLKALQTRPQWIGLVAHGAAERALQAARRGHPVDPDDLRRAVVAEAAAHVAAARAGGSPGFVELTYDGDPGDAAWDTTLAELDAILRQLFAHSLMTRLLAAPSRIVEVEALHRFQLAGQAVAASPDVIVRDRAGGFVVIDWKTGRDVQSADHTVQLTLYALNAATRLGAPLDKVTAFVASVRDGAHHRVHVGPAEVAAATELVATSAAAMRALLPDPTRDVAPISAFPPLPDGHPTCGACRYRRVCRPQPDIFSPHLV